jgi:DNA-binding GntR family transcriptional regulator
MSLNELANNTFKRRQSTPELVADVLRQAILRGLLPAGEPLRQEEIATQCGVSRIPIRAALRQLEAEGLVVFAKNRGVVVTKLSPEVAQELCEIRVALEVSAIRITFSQLTPDDFEQAIAALQALDSITNIVDWPELSWAFYIRLYQPANRPMLFKMIKMLHVNLDRYMQYYLSIVEDLAIRQQAHYDLLSACQQQDLERSVQLLTQQIETTGQQLIQYLQQSRSKRK